MVIFFDIDGTLIDHDAAMGSAAAYLHASLSRDVSKQDFLSDWQAAHQRYYRIYLKGEITYEAARRARIRDTIDATLADEEADRLFEAYLAIYETAWTLFPDVVPCLDRLASFRLGIISNGRADEQRKKLSHFGLVDRFEYILISEDCGVVKPDRQIFRLACESVQISPSDALYIGDQYDIDVCGARNAGLKAVWLDRRGSASIKHHQPIMRSLSDLIQVANLIP